MKVQRKIDFFSVIILLQLVCVTQTIGQLSFTTPPNDYTEEIELILDLYPLSISVSLDKINDFMANATSDLEYDPLLSSPSAYLSNISPLDFTLNWLGDSKVNQYRVGILDLGNGTSDFQVIKTPPFSNVFLGDGPTLVVIQSEAANSSNRNIIVIDKIIMYDEDIKHDCSCYKPTEIPSNVSTGPFYYTIRSFNSNHKKCRKMQFQLYVELEGEEGEFKYKYSWEIENGNRLHLGNNDCSNKLSVQTIPGGFVESLTSDDEKLALRIGEDEVTLEVLSDYLYIENVSFKECCNFLKKGNLEN